MTHPIIADLQWRYACKNFDIARKVADSDLDIILQSARLSASSFGLQPWKFVVIEDHELRSQLFSASFDQKQIQTCSHLIVLCGLTDITDQYIDFVTNTAMQYGWNADRLFLYRKMLMSKCHKFREQGLMQTYISNQVYTVLGNILHTCARLKIDACPMWWFDADRYDDILWLQARDLHAVVLCPIWYRSMDDIYQHEPKQRLSLEDLVVRL